MDITEIWKGIEKWVWRFAHSIADEGVLAEDLVAEAKVIVIGSLNKWDATKASITTFAITQAKYAMMDMMVRERRWAYRNLPIIEGVDAPVKTGWLEGILHEVGEEAKAVLNIILDIPDELTSLVSTKRPKSSYKEIQDYLVDVKDWPMEQVRSAFKEIHNAL